MSQVTSLVLESLAQRQDTRLLDVGPVCGENLECLAHGVKRLYVCDLFLRMMRDRQAGLPEPFLWRHLNYPQASFDAVLLWGLVERLPDEEVRRLAGLMRHLVKPGGLVGLTLQGERGAGKAVKSWVIGPDLTLTPRTQPHLKLPLLVRPNRLIRDLLLPLSLSSSFVYRNGLREYLFTLR